jgi:phenylalanyl-tRNA synthetase alpha chain
VDKDIEQIHEEALQEIKKASTSQQIQSLSVRYLGRKGLVTQFLRNISSLPKDQRPAAGKRTNQVKISLEAAINDALEKLEN